MNVLIDAPKKRSLSPAERKVYDLLQAGFTDVEIAKKIHMRLQNDPYLIYSDIPPDSVRGIMSSIREKGWEIPDNNEEESNMPRGSKTSDEKIAEVQALRSEGKSTIAISKETGVPQTTVQRICHRLMKEKEPAPVAADTSSEKETCENVSDDSITEIPEKVKRKIPRSVFYALHDEVKKLKDFIKYDNDEIARLNKLKDSIKYDHNEIARLKSIIDDVAKHISWCQNTISEIEAFIDNFGGADND